MHRPEPDRRAQVIYVFRIGQTPGAGAPVIGIVFPLGSESLRTALVHGDAVFEIGGVPCGNAALGGADLKQDQRLALKLRLPDGMLHDEPRGFRAILPGDVFTRPAVLRDQFAQAGSIAHVDRFHARNIGAAQFSGCVKFAAHAQIFRAQVEELPAKRLVDHSDIDTGWERLSA